MSSKTKWYLDRANTSKHLNSPEVGDYFDEHLSYKIWVLEVGEDHVVYADTTDCEKRYASRMILQGKKLDPDVRCETPQDLQLNHVTRMVFAKKTYVDYVGKRSVDGWLDTLRGISEPNDPSKATPKPIDEPPKIESNLGSQA